MLQQRQFVYGFTQSDEKTPKVNPKIAEYMTDVLQMYEENRPLWEWWALFPWEEAPKYPRKRQFPYIIKEPENIQDKKIQTTMINQRTNYIYPAMPENLKKKVDSIVNLLQKEFNGKYTNEDVIKKTDWQYSWKPLNNFLQSIGATEYINMTWDIYQDYHMNTEWEDWEKYLQRKRPEIVDKYAKWFVMIEVRRNKIYVNTNVFDTIEEFKKSFEWYDFNYFISRDFDTSVKYYLVEKEALNTEL